jgi:molybdopterin synthase catalytic subunit
MIRVQAAPFDPAEETAALIRDSRGAGAVATFVGLVRGTSEEGPINSLYLDQYEGFTEAGVRAIGEAAHCRFPLLAARIVHRYGDLKPGEPIVFVGAAAEHRRAALDAVDYLMDRLKTDAPFWKKEIGPEGSSWVEPREADYRDRERWERE